MDGIAATLDINCTGACTAFALPAVPNGGATGSEGSVHIGKLLALALLLPSVGLQFDPVETGSIQKAPPPPLVVGPTAHIAVACATFALVRFSPRSDEVSLSFSLNRFLV